MTERGILKIMAIVVVTVIVTITSFHLTEKHKQEAKWDSYSYEQQEAINGFLMIEDEDGK